MIRRYPASSRKKQPPILGGLVSGRIGDDLLLDVQPHVTCYFVHDTHSLIRAYLSAR
jgi:hypothetical protein